MCVVNYKKLRWMFYEWIGSLSVNEIVNNRAITPVLERIGKRLAAIEEVATCAAN